MSTSEALAFCFQSLKGTPCSGMCPVPMYTSLTVPCPEGPWQPTTSYPGSESRPGSTEGPALVISGAPQFWRQQLTKQ